MRKGRDVMGQPIFDELFGRHLGTGKDVIFDPDSKRVLGILAVDKETEMQGPQVVPIEHVVSIGDNGIMVDEPNAITGVNFIEPIKKAYKQGEAVSGTHLLTQDGESVGTLRDIYFDEKKGTLEGYEVLMGLTGGSSIVPASADVELGEDAAIIPPSAVPKPPDSPINKMKRKLRLRKG